MQQVPVAPNEVLLVNFDLTHGPENRLCIVGKKDGDKGAITIVNAFEGQQAEDIFKLLSTADHKKNPFRSCWKMVGVDLANGPDFQVTDYD